MLDAKIGLPTTAYTSLHENLFKFKMRYKNMNLYLLMAFTIFLIFLSLVWTLSYFMNGLFETSDLVAISE